MNLLESLPFWALAWIAVVMLLSGFVHGAIGFGLPIIATPLLALVLDLKAAVLVVILPNITMNVISMVSGGRLRESLGRYGYLPVFLVAGSYVGTRILIAVDAAPFILVLAGMLFVYLNLERLGNGRFAGIPVGPYHDRKSLKPVIRTTAGALAFLFVLLHPGQPLAQTLREQLFAAIESFHQAEVERLVHAGVHYTAKNAEGETPLYVSAEKGSQALVKLLLDNGADADARTPNGETALHASAMNEEPAVALLLLDRGADRDAANRDGETALHWAVMSGTVPVVKLLVERGASVLVADARGNTPLHAAAALGNAELVAFLLSNNARRASRNRAGQRAIDLARQRGHAEVAALLAGNPGKPAQKR